jgi:transcriptional regulator with XRE-family HTH domain
VARQPKTEAILPRIGANIRRAREARGLTQEEAAERAQIDYKRWQRIESGTVNCTVRTLARVAEALSLSFWDLVRDEA